MRGRQTTAPQPRQTGFTIVEVMIVLAVTGLMFITVAIVISGKQQSTQFQTAINEAASRIRQIANEVQSGYFPDDGTYDCQVKNGSITISNKDSNVPPSGDCNSIGKVLHFYSQGSMTDNYSVYSVVGIDANDGTYLSAKPVLVAAPSGASSDSPSAYTHTGDATQHQKLGYGLVAATMTYSNPALNISNANIGSFALMQSLNKNISSDTVPGSGQHLTLLAFPSTRLGTSSTDTEASEVDTINNQFQSTNAGPDEGGTVQLCFNSGSTNQHGIISIGDQASKLSVTLQIGNGLC